MGSFQTAVLYPLAAFGLFLPTGTALGLEFGLHLFLAGAFTFAWTRGLGLGPMGAFYAGAVLMLGVQGRLARRAAAEPALALAEVPSVRRG